LGLTAVYSFKRSALQRQRQLKKALGNGDRQSLQAKEIRVSLTDMFTLATIVKVAERRVLSLEV